MRFHPTLLSFLLCLLLPLHAMADPAFYRINKGNEQHWLLGSIHAGKPSLYPLPDPVERAWQQSRALVMEVDMTHISQAQWQEMGAITRLVDGKTLKDHLPIDLYRRTLIAAGQNGLNESMLAPLRPWFAAITLTQAALERTGFRGEFGVDQHFAKRANDGGKPIVGLETLLEQLGYLASVGDNQTLMLESTLDELPELEKGFTEVMAAWQNGDQATLINLLKEEMAPPKLQAWLEQTLLAERNRNWVKKWPSLPNESFIVVGALHLYGEHGLLALLEQQGWRITPLTDPAPERAK
ncbi:TraB/GumN family protein [Aeromonas caviae]|uniref:Conjugative transfer protein GumN n=1 Tax=Aeromonas caviae TaxID=648 RepID=A0AAV4YN98_AERCA|nr:MULTISPECIES: TraB/GumN family protein [Aeromonas]MDH0318861.1 TraB/GumN family protein [Aeromonas caviae]MDH1448063.1 TraB/GumN family protein [Aeromonas caviae]MDH1452280.1 TraB/GumN family protein [Aeromonas caviae]MDH1498165.1 TraB/GumN family protein [Aeromonas caviae]MEB6605122.1 TraB/GumN family protein [Aeromonas sanarellii]